MAGQVNLVVATTKQKVHMIQTFKLTAPVAAVFLGLAAFQAQADHTNLVQNVNIRLLGITQGGTRTNGVFVTTTVSTVRVGTGAVIGALGAATGNSFSDQAQLVAVTILPDGPAYIQVRDGSNDVDVTGFFSHESLSDSVSTSVLNTGTGRSAETDYSIQRFTLHDVPTLSFDVQGIATERLSNAATPRSDLSADVVGSGNSNGQLLILQGSINVRGGTLEVVTDPGDSGGPGV
jgi:hypothetical protein